MSFKRLTKPLADFSSKREANLYSFYDIFAIVLDQEEDMKDLLLMVGFVAVWFVVNRFVLPRMGVPT